MTTPFERFAANSLELALMRKGFVVSSEPRILGKPSLRLDLLATNPSNQRSVGIDIKVFDRKIRPAPKPIKPRRAQFQSTEIPVYTVFVSSEPKRIYLDKELAEIIQLEDHYVSVLRDAV